MLHMAIATLMMMKTLLLFCEKQTLTILALLAIQEHPKQTIPYTIPFGRPKSTQMQILSP
jgi:hypothetical protein